MKPRALLFDLDDTIISAYGRPETAWRAVVNEFEARLPPTPIADIAAAISTAGKAFWSDPIRHKTWRMRIRDARREIVATAFAKLSDNGVAVPKTDIAIQLADRFSDFRDEQMCLFPDALAVIDDLRNHGFRMGLITNGAASDQRAKIVRFDLAERFDHIQIEEEIGFGKPEERAYTHALDRLGAAPEETWIIGDNLEWEVRAPQRLGIYAVWHDALAQGLPSSSDVKPDLVITALSDLRRHLG